MDGTSLDRGRVAGFVVADKSRPSEYAWSVTLESYAGFYEASNALIVVTQDGDQLFVQLSGQIKILQPFVQLFR